MTDRETRIKYNEIRATYKEKFINIVNEKYPKLSDTQKKILTSILLADSLTAEQMKEDEIYKEFSLGIAQKIENDIILTSASSATLRALEKKGIIEIIQDGREYIDRIKVIKH